MLYLIAGSPRCGKSTVGKKLAQTIGCSRYQTDYLALAIWYRITREQELLPDERWNEWIRDDNWISNDERFTRFSHEEQIAYYQRLAEWSWDGIKAIATRALTDQEDIVLEGFHLRPSIVASFVREHVDHVRYLLLYKSDIIEIELGIAKHTVLNDDRSNNKIHHPDVTYPRIAEFVYKFGQELKPDADSHGLVSHDMSQGNFFQQMEIVVKKIVG